MDNQSNTTYKTLLVILPIVLFLFVTVYFVKNQNSQQNTPTGVNAPKEHLDTTDFQDILSEELKKETPTPKDTKGTVLGVWKESEYEPNIWELIKEGNNYIIIWKDHLTKDVYERRYKCTKTVIKNSSKYIFYTPNLPNTPDGYFTLAKGEVIYVCQNFEELTYKETLILYPLADGNACLYLNDSNPKIFEQYSYLVPCN